MSEKKKSSLCKPPVPARPKNLVVLNSKHLPKPPGTSAENVTNLIKDLNLDIKGERNEVKNFKQGQRFEANSDGEEDTYGYLEPVSLSSMNQPEIHINGKSANGIKKFGCDENSKLGGILRKVISRNSFVPSEVPEVEESKPQMPQSQWQRPLPSLPLPPIETKLDVTSMPWYKNLDRKKGEEVLKNGVDGYFLVRPSSNIDTYLTLMLWYNKRVYNIPIRKRKDGRFALGTPKANEQSFETIEYMVKNYQSEKLVLYSNGVQTGKTLLTTHPP